MTFLDRRLYYFLEVAKAGSLQAAGQKIGLTQSALTSAMKKLEDELSVKLFRRVRFGLELTSEGKKFHHWLSSEDHRLKTSFDEVYVEAKNTLRIGSGFFMLQKYLDLPIQKLIREKLKIQILSHSFPVLLSAVESGYLDFAFLGWEGPLPSKLKHQRLFDCPCAIVGRKGFHDHISDFKSLSELGNEHWIVEGDANSPDGWRRLMENRPGTLVNQHELFRKYVLSGIGVAEIEVHYFTPDEQRRLVYSLIPSQHKRAWYGIVYRDGLPDHLLNIAEALTNDLVGRHKALWPNLKNGSPSTIRNYISNVTAGRRS